jgi:hypothetical protein
VNYYAALWRSEDERSRLTVDSSFWRIFIAHMCANTFISTQRKINELDENIDESRHDTPAIVE